MNFSPKSYIYRHVIKRAYQELSNAVNDFIPAIKLIQTEAERRRREAGVKQSMSDETRSWVMDVCMYVCVCGFGQYFANQGT